MSFNWTDYLQLAQQLLGQDAPVSTEAKQRTAISRAYYAAYNEARRFARQHGFRESQFDNHRSLIEHFLNEPLREGRNIGENLRRLRDQRNDADYQLRFDRLDYHARTTLTLATALLEQIRLLRERNA
jgi:uncharacterized protein (UPF0332 family)